MPEPLESVYQNLVKTNPDLEKVGYDSFANDMKDDTKLNAVFNHLADKNPDLKSYGFDKFKTDMLGGTQEKKNSVGGADLSGDQSNREAVQKEQDAYVDSQVTKDFKNTVSTAVDQIKPPKEEVVKDQPQSTLPNKYSNAFGEKDDQATMSFATNMGKTLKIMPTEIKRSGIDALISHFNFAKSVPFVEDYSNVDYNMNPISKGEDHILPELQKSRDEASADIKKYQESLQGSALNKYTSGLIAQSAPLGVALLTRNPALIEVASDQFVLNGFSQFKDMYYDYMKETKQPVDENKATLVGLVGAITYKAPIMEIIKPFMPKEAVGGALGALVKDNMEGAMKASEIVENYFKDKPDVMSRVIQQVKTQTKHGLISGAIIDASQQATENLVIGKPWDTKEAITNAVHTVGGMVAMSYLMAPFGMSAQSAQMEAYRKVNGVNLGVDGNNKPVDIIKVKDITGQEVYQGIHADGTSIDISPELASKAHHLDYEQFKDLSEKFKKTGTIADKIDIKPSEAPAVKTEPEVAPRTDDQIKADLTTKNEEIDKDVLEAQKRLGLSDTPPVNISHDTDVTLDKIDKGEPVTNEFLGKASDELYQNYKMLEAMKKSDKRTHSIEQIESMQEYLGEEITNLENHVNKQKETGEFIGKNENSDAPKSGTEENLGETPESEKRLVQEQINNLIPKDNATKEGEKSEDDQLEHKGALQSQSGEEQAEKQGADNSNSNVGGEKEEKVVVKEPEPITTEEKQSSEKNKENNFDVREKELSLLNENESNRQDEGRTVSGEVGRPDSGGTGSEGGYDKTPRYVVGKGNRVVRDESVVKKASLSEDEISAIKKKLPNAIFDDSFSEVNNAEQFHKLLSNSKKGNKFSASVFVYPKKEYKNSRLFLTHDGKAGLAITKDGDIISVFSHGEGKGRVAQLIIHAIKEGGVSLDHYDTRLTDIYSRFGFVPTARVKWNDAYAPKDWNKETFKDYNNGEPDVIAMAYHGGDPKTLAERVGKFGDVGELLKDTPYVDNWEDAKKMQQDYVNKIKDQYKTAEDGEGKNPVSDVPKTKAETKKQEIEDAIRKAKSPEDAVKAVQKIKDVPQSVSQEFTKKYNPDGKKTKLEETTDYYNDLKKEELSKSDKTENVKTETDKETPEEEVKRKKKEELDKMRDELLKKKAEKEKNELVEKKKNKEIADEIRRRCKGAITT